MRQFYGKIIGVVGELTSSRNVKKQLILGLNVTL